MAEQDGLKRAWIRQVLGVDLAAPSGHRPDIAQAVAAWQAALAQVDGQIAALQRVLKAAPDEDLQEIAEFGLNAMTASHRVKFQAALVEAQSGAGGAKAARLAGAFRDHLNADPRVAACDSNPFGVALTIRRTLVSALGSLQAALQAADASTGT